MEKNGTYNGQSSDVSFERLYQNVRLFGYIQHNLFANTRDRMLTSVNQVPYVSIFDFFGYMTVTTFVQHENCPTCEPVLLGLTRRLMPILVACIADCPPWLPLPALLDGVRSCPAYPRHWDENRLTSTVSLPVIPSVIWCCDRSSIHSLISTAPGHW